MNLITLLQNISKPDDWRSRWLQRGMICVRVASRIEKAGFKDFECKDLGGFRQEPLLIGCGGWDDQDRLHWVGLDLDVQHGKQKATVYDTTEEAVDAALRCREFLGNAAEVRLSKSGVGVHIRVAVAGELKPGRAMARNVAYWIAEKCGIRCDRTVLGRQNLWLWQAGQAAERAFELVAPCEQAFFAPSDAQKEPEAPAPVCPRIDSSGPRTNDLASRAEKYVSKIPGAVSGSGGHDRTFHAACVLVLGFGLPLDEARPILQRWNATCQPAWSEKELEHKLTQAAKQSGPRGYLLKDERAKVQHSAWADVDNTPPNCQQAPADALMQQIEDEISGKRYCCSWPWPAVTKLTNALLPQTVTVLCAPKGSGKSFKVIQCGIHWWEQQYKPAILMLEEDRTFHLRRALAQHTENGNLADPGWTKANHTEARKIALDNREFLNGFGPCIHEVLESISTASVLSWLEQVSKAGSRVVVIDPITAKDPSFKPYVDDHQFMMGAKRIVRKYENSLVVVSHPPKQSQPTAKNAAWGDDVAGGMAYQNFSQNILWLQYMQKGEEVQVSNQMGRVSQYVNRKLQLRKTRSKDGQGQVIGFFFNGKTLKFEERGVVAQ